MFYAGWNYDVRMKLVRMYGRDSEVHVRQEVPPSEYVDRMLSAKFCPVCGGFSQWTPRLAEAIYYECVPVILSPHMLPPWSEILDWSTFAVRLDPTAATLKGLKAHLASLDHASLFRNVRAAKHALTYQLDGYTGADLLPLLPCETHRRAAVTSWCAIIRRRPAAAAAVRDAQASGGVHTAAEGGARALQQRRGGARLRRRRSQRALAEGPRGERHVFAPVRAGGAALLDVRSEEMKSGVRDRGHACQQAWRCSTSDGYMCSCSKERARTAGVRPGGAGTPPPIAPLGCCLLPSPLARGAKGTGTQRLVSSPLPPCPHHVHVHVHVCVWRSAPQPRPDLALARPRRAGTGGGAAPESAFAAGSSPVPTPHPAGPLVEEARSETGHGHELHHST